MLIINIAMQYKTSSLVTASYKMVLYFKICHIKLVLFMNEYYCSKFELYRGIRGWRLSMA